MKRWIPPYKPDPPITRDSDDLCWAASRNGDLTFSPVVSWLDKRTNETGHYLQLATDTGHRVTLSSQHVMFVRQEDALVSR